MGFISKKEVIQQTGKDATFINRYAKRGHLIFSVNPEGVSLLDTEFPLNRKFLDKWTISEKGTQNEIISSPEVKAPKSATGIKSPKSAPGSFGAVKMDPKKVAAFDLSQEIKTVELEKARQDLALARYRAAKLHGDVIPVDLVINIFSQHTKFVVTEYRNSLDKMISQIAIMHKLSNAEVAQLKTIINKEINLAGEKSLNESLKKVDSIQEGYSLKRGRGERN